MEHVKKSLTLAIVAGLLLTSGFTYTDEGQVSAEQSPVSVEQSPVVCNACDEGVESIMGAWVVNATAFVRTPTLFRAGDELQDDFDEYVAPVTDRTVTGTKVKVRSYGNVLYSEDGGFVSAFSLGIKHGFPDFFTLDTHATTGTGAWHKAGHRLFKSVSVHEQVLAVFGALVPSARVRTEMLVKVSKCGQFFEGKMISTFFRIGDLSFTKPLPICPVKWKVEGARFQ